MPGLPLPPPFDEIGSRHFSFYPSIVNAEPNEWLLKSASWSEVQVINARTQQEVWIPRQYIGSVSEAEDPVIIIGLTKELEFKAGAVWPRVKRVIEMPRAVNAANESLLRPRLQTPELPEPAPVVGIRIENGTDSKAGRLLIYAGVAAILVSLLVLVVFRDWIFSGKVSYRPVVQMGLGLTIADDYSSVVRRLGPPETDHWRSDKGSLQFRALAYPKEKRTVILMGEDRNHMRYIGSMSDDWQPVDTVKLGQHTDSGPLLEHLPKL